MLKKINNLPDNIIGISAEGEVTGTDYTNILIPAVEEKLKTHKKVSLLYHLGSEFKGFSMTAMMDDAKIGLKHFTSWEKIAMVSDHPMVNMFVKFFGYMMPCEVRIFKDSGFEEAKKWITTK